MIMTEDRAMEATTMPIVPWRSYLGAGLEEYHLPST
jgi:hypothetical protein